MLGGEDVATVFPDIQRYIVCAAMFHAGENPVVFPRRDRLRIAKLFR